MTTPNTDTLTKLVQALDAKQGRYAELDRYYAGRQPLAYLSADAKTALGGRLDRMVSNLCRLAVGALSERLRVTGLTVDGTTDPDLWAAWLRNDLDQLAPVAHREALTLGQSFAVVWADPLGRSQVSIESARQLAVLRDPGTRKITAALKRWTDTDDAVTYAVQFGGNEIVRLQADGTNAAAGWRTVETIANPLGVIPVVAFTNTDRLLDDGCSELSDLLPLVDGLNKLLADMMVSSEYAARPRRWATGIELEEEPVLDDDGNPVTDDNGDPVTEAVNPYPEANRMMISEDPASKFGQLSAADLAAYDTGVSVLLGQIMAVSALPAHYVGVLTDSPVSADALRASEAALAARAEAKQASFGRSWEAVARLMVAVDTGRDPGQVTTSVQWADPGTRSIGQEADAVVKLVQAGILPPSAALAKLGYADDERAALTPELITD